MVRGSSRITVIGGGPAGCAAALAALSEGSAVTLYEKSRFPRHKVCGEFLSPELGPALESLGLWSGFLAAGPARITRAVLHLGPHLKRFKLPEPAYSLSRYSLDHMLLREATLRGADLRVEAAKPGEAPTILAHGRQATARAGERLFGFKAHFRGPVDDAVELFFFRGCYVGVSSVENQFTNVCGLAPERLLLGGGFSPEALFSEPLRERVAPLERAMEWLITGPLVFRDEFKSRTRVYLAGDALGFVDPFTGSGVLAALLTGRLAGQAAVRGCAVEEHLAACRRVLGRQYNVASLLRRLLGAGLAEKLAAFVPGRMLYRMTRPAV